MGFKPRRPAPKCRWYRSDDGHYYYQDERYGYGYIHKAASGREWYACIPGKKSGIFVYLNDAKKFVERLVAQG
jgi:hypothetical protein